MTDSYHLMELRTAGDPADPRRVNPPSFPAGCRVLDVGCGAGQTLITCYGDRRSFGVDVDLDALRLGRSLTKQVSYVCAAAEHLPFYDGGFDVVVARVSLPYSDLGRSLQEIRRVLKTGGFFWSTWIPITYRWYKKINIRSLIRSVYILLNSLLFHFTGRVVPYKRGRYESFQTSSGIERALRKAGFSGIAINRQAHFVVTAEATPKLFRGR